VSRNAGRPRTQPSPRPSRRGGGLVQAVFLGVGCHLVQDLPALLTSPPKRGSGGCPTGVKAVADTGNDDGTVIGEVGKGVADRGGGQPGEQVGVAGRQPVNVLVDKLVREDVEVGGPMTRNLAELPRSRIVR
jgi:hypothetical protein